MSALVNADVERAALSAAIQHPHLLDDLGESLFTDPLCRQVRAALRELQDANVPLGAHGRTERMDGRVLEGWDVDFQTIANRLSVAAAPPPPQGWLVYLVDLAGVVTGPAHFKSHAGILRALDKLRRLRGELRAHVAAIESLDMGTLDGSRAEKLRLDAEQAIFDLRRDDSREGAVSAHQSLVTLRARLVNGLPTGLETGIEPLSRKLGPLRPGHVTVVGAATSIGKTAFGVQLGINVAECGHVTLLISLEMSVEDLAERLGANLGEINSRVFATNKLSPTAWSRFDEEMERMKDVPLYFDDSSNSLSAIASQVRAIGRRGKPVELLIVDYVQLVSPIDHKAPREQQVSAISRKLKRMARELNVHVIALAQLNRAGSEPGVEPELSHLRESGSLEQDASAVVLLSRDRTTHATKLVAHVRKNRGGERGDVELTFNLEHQRVLSAGYVAEAIYP